MIWGCRGAGGRWRAGTSSPSPRRRSKRTYKLGSFLNTSLFVIKRKKLFKNTSWQIVNLSKYFFFIILAKTQINSLCNLIYQPFSKKMYICFLFKIWLFPLKRGRHHWTRFKMFHSFKNWISEKETLHTDILFISQKKDRCRVEVWIMLTWNPNRSPCRPQGCPGGTHGGSTQSAQTNYLNI